MAKRFGVQIEKRSRSECDLSGVESVAACGFSAARALLRLGAMRTNQKFYLVWLVLGILQVFTPNGSSASALLAADVEEPSIAALRVSRDFFQRNLRADVRVAGGNNNEVEQSSSPVDWQETESSLPPSDSSEGPILASFPDSRGCARFEAGDLCFQMMGDVSNLGLNDHEMSFESKTPSEYGPYHMISAKRSRDQVEVIFKSGPYAAHVTLTAAD